jgi:hypothetical protein
MQQHLASARRAARAALKQALLDEALAVWEEDRRSAARSAATARRC